LVVALVWIFSDGRSLRNVQSLQGWLGIGNSTSSTGLFDTRIPLAVQAMALGLVLAIGTLTTMFCSLLVRASRFRTTRWWLLFTGVVCGWLGLLMTWPEIYWRGQQVRVRARLDAAADVVKTVTANWPASDGEIAGVGSFLAYPPAGPSTLLMLGEGESSHAALKYSAIERSVDGTIRFELAGSEAGAWLEWRPDETRPQSFVGGLATHYVLGQNQQLAPRWYLVRYRASYP
jgi:hypothetical protein